MQRMILDQASSSTTDAGSIFFIGTATTLIRYLGFTILTDPNFLHRGARIDLGYGLHARRLTEPAIAFDDLPDVDLVLLSHMHEDHFDRVVTESLDRTMPIVTTPHASVALRAEGFVACVPLRTWAALEVVRGNARVTISSVPARHGPRLISSFLPPTMGSVLEFSSDDGRRFRMWVSGDTLVHPSLHEIRKHFPGIDLALVHLGGTRVLGILVTMDDEQGVEALEIVQPSVAIPIHYDDYDRFRSPLSDFQRTVDRSGWSDRVHYMQRGDTYSFGESMRTPLHPVP